MRVLVCGGRAYDNATRVTLALNKIHADPAHVPIGPIQALIEGGAPGVDAMARLWAESHRVPVLSFPAQWLIHGKAAGPIRNQQMLDEGKPDLVVAFPGGRGTADMVRRAKAAGVRVIDA